MRDPSFANPNKELEETYKNLEKERFQYDINKVFTEKMREIQKLKLE